MTPYDPREVLNGFLEYLDREIEENPESFQRLMDWFAVEALDSKELLDEVDLLLALKMNIEADCFQSSVEEPEVPEKIPAYRRPALNPSCQVATESKSAIHGIFSRDIWE